MPINVPCPSCTKKLRVADKAAGLTVRCPACHQPLTVPALTASTLTPPPLSSGIARPPAMPARKMAPPTPPTGSNPLFWVVTVGSALLLLGGAVVIIVLLSNRPGSSGSKSDRVAANPLERKDIRDGDGDNDKPRDRTADGKVGDSTTRDKVRDANSDGTTRDRPRDGTTSDVKPTDSTLRDKPRDSNPDNTTTDKPRDAIPDGTVRDKPRDAGPDSTPRDKPRDDRKQETTFSKYDLITVKVEEAPKHVRPESLWGGHRETIRSVAFSSDGKFALSASGDINDAKNRLAPDKTVRLWDARRGKLLRTSAQFNDGLASVAFSPGGRFALLCSAGKWVKGVWNDARDHNVRLWDVQENQEIGAKGGIGDTRPKKVKGGETVARFQGHDGDVFTVCMSSDGRRVAAGANNGRILIWDGETGALVSQCRINAIVHSVCFTPDGRQLLSAGYDRLLHLWDVETGRELHTFRQHTDNTLTVTCFKGLDGKVYALSGGGGQYDANTARFLTGTRDFTIRLWDLEARTLVRSFTGHTDWVECVAIAPNGRHFASASFDKTVRVWDLETGKQLSLFTGHTDLVRGVAISPDGRYALSGGDDNNLRLWDMPLSFRDVSEALDKGDADLLARTVRDLPAMGPEARKAIPRFLAALRSDKEAIRNAAGDALRRLRPLSAEEAPVALLTDLLNKGTVPERLFALETLAAQGSNIGSAMDSLRTLLKDTSTSIDVRRQIARTLGEVRLTARPAVADLCALLAAESEDALLRGLAAESLGKIGVRDREVVEALVKAIKQENRELRRGALKALLQLRPAPGLATLEAVLKAGEDADAEVGSLVRKAMQQMNLRGPEVVQLLQRTLSESKQLALRLEVISSLARLGAEAKDAVPALAELLKDSNEQLRLRAGVALLSLDFKRVENMVPVLVMAVKPDVVNNGSNKEAADAALKTAEQARKGLVKAGKSAVPAVLDALEKTFPGPDQANTQARLALYQTLAEIGPTGRTPDCLLRLNRLVSSEESLRLRGPTQKTPLGALYFTTHRAARAAVTALQRKQ